MIKINKVINKVISLKSCLVFQLLSVMNVLKGSRAESVEVTICFQF